MKVDPEKCIACKRCFPLLPHGKNFNSFKRSDKIKGRVYIEIDQEACTDCGMCLRADICPVKALFPAAGGLAAGSGAAFLSKTPLIEFKGSQVPGRGTEEMKNHRCEGHVFRPVSSVLVSNSDARESGLTFRDVENRRHGVDGCRYRLSIGGRKPGDPISCPIRPTGKTQGWCVGWGSHFCHYRGNMQPGASAWSDPCAAKSGR